MKQVKVTDMVLYIPSEQDIDARYNGATSLPSVVTKVSGEKEISVRAFSDSIQNPLHRFMLKHQSELPEQVSAGGPQNHWRYPEEEAREFKRPEYDITKQE